MYTDKNFKTKKALKDAVKAYVQFHTQDFTLCTCDNRSWYGSEHDSACQLQGTRKEPRAVTYFQPGGMFPAPTDGTFCCEGPHYPEPHKWYATCTAKDGVIVKVK